MQCTDIQGRTPKVFALAITLILLWYCTGIVADTLEMPSDIGASADERKVVDKPSRGMTMDDVTLKYGEPLEMLPAVGDPPITRWIYPEFVVNFERQYVIYAVVPRKPR